MNNTQPLESGFSALEDCNAKVLILGSMPSVQSLKDQQYYAHPRNAFWPIMSAIFHIEKGSAYERRCDILIQNHIAVWDAIKACQRQGSLDQSIDATSMIANDFNVFLQQHPNIQQIFFNGGKAEEVFNRYVLPKLNEYQVNISRQRLPSTSPAHAAMNFEQKLHSWRQAIQFIKK